MMKKCLVTAAGPAMAEVLDLSEPTHREFAARHGYEVIVHRHAEDHADRDDARSVAARWGKIGVLRRALETCDLAVWLDADLMFTRFDKDLAEDFPDDCFQAFVLEQFPHRFNPNTGLWAMRRCERSFRFLDAVEAVGGTRGGWADQSAVCATLGWELDPDFRVGGGVHLRARPVTFSPYLRGTSWLPAEWNPLGFARKWPGRARHFSGMGRDERMVEMRALLDSLKAGGLVS